MRRPSRSLVITGLALVLLAAVGTWQELRQQAPASRAASAIPVRVVAVAQQDVPRYLSAIGSVLSLHSVEVRPRSRAC